MRILIIGEYSGLAKHLKNGFTALGHKVTIVSAGDGFKKIKSGPDDINYEIKSLKLLGRHLPKSHLLFSANKNRELQKQLNLIQEQIDLILVINYSFLSNSLLKVGVQLNYLQKIISNGANLIMLCCGGDPALMNNYSKGYLKYNIEKFPDGISKNALKRDLRFDFLIKYSDLIIPTSYEYFDSIKRYTLNTPANNKISNVIPIPIKIDNYSFNSCIGRKIVVFHGVIREQAKGTKHFLKALKKVEKEFPDKIEVIIDGKMPYDDYIKLLDKVDILLDQTNAYGIGVNAALGLMKGKVVLGGNEKENEDNMNLGKVPIINVIPDSEYIYEVLKELILNPRIIDDIKVKSRKFAEEHLDSKIVAKRYLDLLN